jgi:SAM-dependent methyltransferase
MLERTHCPICQQPAPVLFSRPYSHPALQCLVGTRVPVGMLEGKDYEIRRCGASDLCFQTWVMEDTELAGWYSAARNPESFLQEAGRQRLHWFAHVTEEILVMRQLVPSPRPVVLDFGCNWGKWATMALAHGCDVFAVDVNRDAAAFCASRGIQILDYGGLAGRGFDFINVDQVVEHLSEPGKVVQHLAASLKPGGFLKLSTPDNPRLPDSLRHAETVGDDSVLNAATLDSLLPMEHVNLFTATSLRSLAAVPGLEPVRLPFWKWVGAGQLWNLPRQFNRNVVVPFKRAFNLGTYGWFQRRSH